MTLITDRQRRKQVAAAEAAVSALDLRISILADEIAAGDRNLSLLRNRVAVVKAGTPAEDDGLDDVADRLLADPDAPTGDGWLTRLVAGVRKRSATANEQAAMLKALNAAIAKGEGEQQLRGEELEGLKVQRRQAWIAFVEASHAALITEIEGLLDHASSVAQAIYALQDEGVGRLRTRLSGTSRVFLVDHAPATIKARDREIFPRLPHRASTGVVKVMAGGPCGSALRLLREELRGESDPARRAAA